MVNKSLRAKALKVFWMGVTNQPLLIFLFKIVQNLINRWAKDGANGVPNFIRIHAQEDWLCLRFIGKCIWCEEELELEIKSGNLPVCVTSKLSELFLSNLVCKVVNIGPITFINYAGIAPIVFKL